VLLVGLVAGRCWGTVGGVVAAVVIALDPASVANSRHIMLEVPMTLLIAAALLASAEAAGPGGRLAAGALAGLAGLVKVQAWLLAAAEAGVLIARRRWQELAGLVGGLLIVPLVLAPVLAIAGPGRVLRQLVLFQLLRPPDGLEDLGARLASLLAPSGALIGLLAAPIGLALAWSAGIRSTRTVAPVALWVGLELLSFLVSRSYYGHYASQLTPGLAVLAGGLGAAWTADSAGRRWRRGLIVATGLALTGLALTAVGRAMLAPPDRTFVVVAQYVADAAPPRALVLATDVQFNYLASRPLPHTEAGFLVDSYGQLLFTGLGLDRGGLGEAAGRALAARQGATVYDIMWSAPAQALLRAHAKQAEVVVVHAVGRARLTAETTAWLGQRFQMVESTRRYAIYRRSER
jgi:4-amino-4-deoxy-L-arabinose transferase-like glycosyltransferase